MYKRLYSGGVGNKLKKAERVWVKFKEADCDSIASDVNLGKEYIYIYKACLVNKTKERIEDFKRSYSLFACI